MKVHKILDTTEVVLAPREQWFRAYIQYLAIRLLLSIRL